MADDCCSTSYSAPPRDQKYRRIIIAALLINATMFGVEAIAGLAASSVSLQADALDFLADAANYGLSLAVLDLTLKWRARAALVKGWSLGILGVVVLVSTTWNVIAATIPEADVMGAVGILALLANLGVAALLFAYRRGDSNMRSVWLCSRNDAIANVAVLVAALGVFSTGTGWPDIVVASIIATLSVSAALQIIRQATTELRSIPRPVAAE